MPKLVIYYFKVICSIYKSYFCVVNNMKHDIEMNYISPIIDDYDQWYLCKSWCHIVRSPINVQYIKVWKGLRLITLSTYMISWWSLQPYLDACKTSALYVILYIFHILCLSITKLTFLFQHTYAHLLGASWSIKECHGVTSVKSPKSYCLYEAWVHSTVLPTETRLKVESNPVRFATEPLSEKITNWLYYLKNHINNSFTGG